MQEINASEPNHCPQEALFYFKNYYSSHCIDITQEPPLKVLLIRQPKQAYLIFFVHHAASDGIGFLYFMQHFIKCYEGMLYQVQDIYQQDVKAISLPDINLRWLQLSWHRLYPYLKQIALLQREPPLKVKAPIKDQTSERTLTVIREVSPHAFNTIRAKAKQHQATINHYMLAAMFHTIKKWTLENGDDPGRIYINVPISLRTPGDYSVSNTLSGFNISFSSNRIAEREEMVRIVQREMSSLIKGGLADTSVNLACLFKPIPIPLKRLLFKSFLQTAHPTLTLSNIGVCDPNPLRKDAEGFSCFGSARISSVSIIGFAAPWPQVVVLTYNNTMVITLSVARPRFSLETAEILLDSFISALLGEKSNTLLHNREVTH